MALFDNMVFKPNNELLDRELDVDTKAGTGLITSFVPAKIDESVAVGKQLDTLAGDKGYGEDGMGIRSSNPFAIRTDVEKHYDMTKGGETPTSQDTFNEAPEEEGEGGGHNWDLISKGLSKLSQGSTGTPRYYNLRTPAAGGGKLGTGYNPFA